MLYYYFLFNLDLEYFVRGFQVNEDGLNLNGTHQLLVYAVDDNIFGGSLCPIKKNIEVSVVANTEIRIEVLSDKTKYMVFPRDQNAGRIHRIRKDNFQRKDCKSSFETFKQFIYLVQP